MYSFTRPPRRRKIQGGGTCTCFKKPCWYHPQKPSILKFVKIGAPEGNCRRSVMKQDLREKMMIVGDRSSSGAWCALSFQDSQLSALLCDISMIFLGSVYILFQKSLSLWSGPGLNMETALWAWLQLHWNILKRKISPYIILSISLLRSKFLCVGVGEGKFGSYLEVSGITSGCVLRSQC